MAPTRAAAVECDERAGTRLVIGTAVLLTLPALAFAALPRDERGYTLLTPSADSRIIHVSSSLGNDANSGLSPDAPVATLSRAHSLVRDNSADWLLLKSGDVWNESFGSWMKRGRSETERIVVGAYGEGARPMLVTQGSAIDVWSQGVNTFSNLAFTGLHFKPAANDGTLGAAGINWHRPGQNLLIENMKIEGYSTAIVVQSVTTTPMRDVEIRRSVLVDSFAKNQSYPGGSHAQGIYTSRVDGVLIEGNVLDHNGWNTEVEGAGPTIYNHNLYIQSDSSGLVVRDNIIARAAATGLQARPGGIVEGNLFIGNSIAFYISGAGGVADGNVVLHAGMHTLYPDNWTRGWGIEMFNIDGSEAINNIIAHGALGATNALTGLNGVKSENNVIYKWGTQTLPGEFIDPERTILSYDALLGGAGTMESFLTQARLMSPDNWRVEYTASGAIVYFQEGFSIPEPATLALVGFGGLLLLRTRQAAD